MSEYNALVNLRFNRTSGPIDLVQNKWNSKITEYDYTVDLVDYSSAGQFSGNCATFNGETSIITKVSGNRLSLDADKEFTVSMWINTNIARANNCEVILSDGDNNSRANTIIIKTNNDNTANIIVTDKGEVHYLSHDIYNLFQNDLWNYLAIIKRYSPLSDGFLLGIYLNGDLVSSLIEIDSPFDFDTASASIGNGVDFTTNTVAWFKGKLDDFVIIDEAIPLNEDGTIPIPTDYLLSSSEEEDAVVWQDKEPEYSRYDSIVKVTERRRFNNKKYRELAQYGLVPYRIHPDWKQTDELYFKDGTCFVNRDLDSVKIMVNGLWDNHFFKFPSSEYRRFEKNFEIGYNEKLFNAAVVFVNGKFVPWSDITVVRSDRYVTLLINNFFYKTVVNTFEMFLIPFNVRYSSKGVIPDNGVRLFGWDKDGNPGGGEYVISSLNPNIRMMKIEDVPGNTVYEPEVNIKHKLTKYNLLIFKAGTNYFANVDYEVMIGNYFNIFGEDTYDVYIIMDIRELSNEDNISLVPNEVRIKSYLTDYNQSSIDTGTLPVDINALKTEFNWDPTWNGIRNDKYANSARYIFDYNRNKFDEVYEEIRPINTLSFDGIEINKLLTDNGDGTSSLILSRDVYKWFDHKDTTYVMIFVNGELPDWYSSIEYSATHIAKFTFPTGTINNEDIVEICFFRNICNIVYPLNESNANISYIKNSYFIPKSDLLVYTDRKGYLNLCPILYNINEETATIELSDEKYAKYNLFIGSRKQFIYKHVPIYKNCQSLPIPYDFRTGYNPDRYLVFLNGRLLDSAFYKVVVPVLNDNRIVHKTIYFVKEITTDDKLEIFYIDGSCYKMNTSGDLVIKAIKVPCSYTNQRKFLIPLPYSNYPVEYETFIVMNKSLRMNVSRYKIYNEITQEAVERWNEETQQKETVYIDVDNYYIELMDQDDYLIPGEELTFIFPYYKAEWETVDEPTNDNSLQFITRYVKPVIPTNVIHFPYDYSGTIKDSRYIYIFINTNLVERDKYRLIDDNTVEFDDLIHSGDEVAMVIETDRYNFSDNNIILHFSDIVVTDYGQVRLDLPAVANKDSFIFFRNNMLLDSDSYTVSGTDLILDRDQTTLAPGDVITGIYATDGSTSTNSVNFKSFNIRAIVKNAVDIPNFTNIRYTTSNIIVFVNNEYIPPVYYTVSGNTIVFKDNAYTIVTFKPIFTEHHPYPDAYVFEGEDSTSIDDNNVCFLRYELESKRGSTIVEIGDEVTVFIAYKAINPNNVNYHLGNKEFIRFSEEKAIATSNNQKTFTIPYPSLISMPFRDNQFLLFIRGYFVPNENYTINSSATSITLTNENIAIKKNDELTFLFCHVYDLTDINKEEYTVELANGQRDITIPSVYTTAINLVDRVMLFYGGTYVDPSRYTIDRLNRTVHLKDIPGDNDYDRKITIVFLYTGTSDNGSIAMLPQSGYICFNEHYIDRNYNRELYMIFVNGKKVPKYYMYDVTNSIKKITVDIKSRYDLIALCASPLITEFKEYYGDSEIVESYDVIIDKVKNGVLEVTCNNDIYYSTFNARYGEFFSVKFIPDKGYTEGTIFVNDTQIDYGNVHNTMHITATDAVPGIMRNVSITQKDDEQIVVKCNNDSYNKDFSEVQGSTIEIYVQCGREGYHAGELTVEGTEVQYDTGKGCYTGVIQDSDISITITDALVDTIPFRILDENMYAQTVSAEFYDKTNRLMSTYTRVGTTLMVQYGWRVKFTVKSIDSRFMRAVKVGPFKINKFYAVDYKWPMNNLIVEPVTPVKRYYVDIKQNANELLYVDTYPNPEIMESTVNRVRHIEPFYASSNEKYIVGAEANYGYTIGTISTSSNKLSGSIEEPLEVSISPAILDTVILYINKDAKASGSITATLESGEIVTVGSYIVQNNSVITITTKINGVITKTPFTIIHDQKVTLNAVNALVFDPELPI